MSVPVLSGRPVPPKTEKEKAKKEQQKRLQETESIPPELLLRRDNSIRYERDGPVYATDGKIGVLKKVVVDEAAGEVIELIIQIDGGNQMVLLPPDVVDKSAGSALFLTINRVQFAERGAAGPEYNKGHFARADIRSLVKKDPKHAASNPRRAVATAGADYVETPSGSPLDRIVRRPEPLAS